MGQLGSVPLQTHFNQSETYPWTIMRSTSVDQEHITVFEHVIGEDAKLTAAAKNALRFLKCLRHPNILHYQWDQQDSSTISIISSPVVPLSEMSDEMTAYDVAFGLYSILKALQFLHEKAQIVHNDISSRCVFVCEGNRRWVLGGFEFACPIANLTMEFLESSKSLRSQDSVPPEDGNKTWTASFSRDLFAFCKLSLAIIDQAKEKGNGESFLLLREVCQDLISSAPTNRLTATQLLNHHYFSNNEFVNVITFLDCITLKAPQQKSAFFQSLPMILRRFPPQLVGVQIIPLLFSRHIFNDDCFQYFAMELFTPKIENLGILELSHFIKYINPEIYRLFQSRETYDRLILLNNIDKFVTAFTKEELTSAIGPEILIGLNDDNDQIVSGSLFALGVVVNHSDGGIVTMSQPRRLIFNPSTRPLSSRSFSGDIRPINGLTSKSPSESYIPVISASQSVKTMPMLTPAVATTTTVQTTTTTTSVHSPTSSISPTVKLSNKIEKTVISPTTQKHDDEDEDEPTSPVSRSTSKTKLNSETLGELNDIDAKEARRLARQQRNETVKAKMEKKKSQKLGAPKNDVAEKEVIDKSQVLGSQDRVSAFRPQASKAVIVPHVDATAVTSTTTNTTTNNKKQLEEEWSDFEDSKNAKTKIEPKSPPVQSSRTDNEQPAATVTAKSDPIVDEDDNGDWGDFDAPKNVQVSSASLKSSQTIVEAASVVSKSSLPKEDEARNEDDGWGDFDDEPKPKQVSKTSSNAKLTNNNKDDDGWGDFDTPAKLPSKVNSTVDDDDEAGWGDFGDSNEKSSSTTREPEGRKEVVKAKSISPKPTVASTESTPQSKGKSLKLGEKKTKDEKTGSSKTNQSALEATKEVPAAKPQTASDPAPDQPTEDLFADMEPSVKARPAVKIEQAAKPKVDVVAKKQTDSQSSNSRVSSEEKPKHMESAKIAEIPSISTTSVSTKLAVAANIDDEEAGDAWGDGDEWGGNEDIDADLAAEETKTTVTTHEEPKPTELIAETTKSNTSITSILKNSFALTVEDTNDQPEAGWGGNEDIGVDLADEESMANESATIATDNKPEATQFTAATTKSNTSTVSSASMLKDSVSPVAPLSNEMTKATNKQPEDDITTPNNVPTTVPEAARSTTSSQSNFEDEISAQQLIPEGKTILTVDEPTEVEAKSDTQIEVQEDNNWTQDGDGWDDDWE